jgi:hypothetical protein
MGRSLLKAKARGAGLIDRFAHAITDQVTQLVVICRCTQILLGGAAALVTEEAP